MVSIKPSGALELFPMVTIEPSGALELFPRSTWSQ